MTNRPSRRSLLQGLASLPLMAALPPFPSARQRENKKKNAAPIQIKSLVVFFHGLFAYVVCQDHLLILAPRVPLNDHVYRVGSWRQEIAVTDGQLYFLNVERESKSTWSNFDATKHPVMKKAGVKYHSNLELVKYGMFALFPDHVVQLRCLNQIGNKPFFSAGVAKGPDTLPLVTALVYENCVVDSQPSVEPNLWIAPPSQDEVHLHVRAEPRDETSSPDGITALGNVFGLGPNDLKLDPAYSDCFVCPDANPSQSGYNITTAEECTLYEIAENKIDPCTPKQKSLNPAMFGRPVNCASMIVDNT
jgi:hypothetical protein